MLQIRREKHRHELCGISRGKKEFTDLFQLAGCHSYLFTDLARGTRFKGFIIIARPSREFEHILPRGMPILSDEMNIAFMINRDDHDRTTMFDDLKLCFKSTGCF